MARGRRAARRAVRPPGRPEGRRPSLAERLLPARRPGGWRGPGRALRSRRPGAAAERRGVGRAQGLSGRAAPPVWKSDPPRGGGGGACRETPLPGGKAAAAADGPGAAAAVDSEAARRLEAARAADPFHDDWGSW